MIGEREARVGEDIPVKLDAFAAIERGQCQKTTFRHRCDQH